MCLGVIPVEAGIHSLVKYKFMKLSILRKGFTLVEMLIVIAIIAILASVALVSVKGVRQSAADTKKISDVSKIQQQLEVYYSRYGNYPPADNFATLNGESGLGVNAKDVDGAWYLYAVSAGDNSQHYVVGAHLSGKNAIMNEPTEIDAGNLPGNMTDPGCEDSASTFGYCVGN